MEAKTKIFGENNHHPSYNLLLQSNEKIYFYSLENLCVAFLG